MTDRDLVRLYWPVELRPAFDALFALDDAFAAVIATTSQPALGAIRLAWWRDALLQLDADHPPAEPRLQAAARELIGRGLARPCLAGLADGWAALLDETPDPEAVAERGASLFVAMAGLLRAMDHRIPEAGALFAFAEARRRGLGRMRDDIPRMHFARALRPATAFAALAARDLRSERIEPEATPARAWTLLRHRWTGRL